MIPVVRDNVILNAGNLRSNEVVHRRIICPGCGNFTFDSWPEGWDGHAQVCAGLEEEDPERRKAEFKATFRHLFA